MIIEDMFDAFLGGEHDAPELDGSRPTKKPRGRQKGWLGPKARAIRDSVRELVPKYKRMTVRQVFYALTVARVMPKEEASGYKPVQVQLTKMRREGVLDWSFIADGTRLVRQMTTWDDADDFLESVRRSYRRDLCQARTCGSKSASKRTHWPRSSRR
jgi:hypothetical protein